MSTRISPRLHFRGYNARRDIADVFEYSRRVLTRVTSDPASFPRHFSAPEKARLSVEITRAKERHEKNQAKKIQDMVQSQVGRTSRNLRGIDRMLKGLSVEERAEFFKHLEKENNNGKETKEVAQGQVTQGKEVAQASPQEGSSKPSSEEAPSSQVGQEKLETA
jgi:hypothetical protein